MNPQTYIGCPVTVILREGSYHGTIHCFDSVDKRITLRDVSNPVSGNKYLGIRHFYAAEILDMVLDDDYDESLMDKPPCAVIKTDEAPAYEDVSPIISKAYDSSPNINTNKRFDYPSASSCDRYTIIEEFNDQFHDTIALFQEQTMIGFHLVSVGEGRHGKICWIAISVDGHVYLFDFLALGKKIFKNGLQEILESKKITKIIHDCRFISDLLFHKYSVNLSNVFDTQVADTFVHRAWYGVGQKNVWPKFVQPLSVCLFGHLNLKPEEIAGLNACEGRSKIDQELWPMRPLSVSLAETLLCCVKYLHELRHLLIEKMMVEYMAGVDIYLSTVRNIPDSEVSWYATKSEFLPKTFYNMNRFTQVIKDSFKNRERDSCSEFSPLENYMERKTGQQMTVSSKMHKNSKSVSSYDPSSVTNPENIGLTKSSSKTKQKGLVKENLEECTTSNDEIITGVPSLPTPTCENKSDLETNPIDNEEDILIQAARKMIASDIPSDLMGLLKTPVKTSPVMFESNPKTLYNSDTTLQNNSSRSLDEAGVEWSRYRKENLSRNKLSLLPAGYSLVQKPKKNKSKQLNFFQNDNNQFPVEKCQPKSCQQLNNENKNPVENDSFPGIQQSNNPDNQITDTFFEIPDSHSFPRDYKDYSVLGQIQTYSVSRQPFQYTAINNTSYSHNDTYNSMNSPSHSQPHPKSQVSGSIKSTHSTKISSQELSLPREKSNSPDSSEVQTESGIKKENGANRNYWVNGNGVVGSGSMTHIERLMAVWRNNCK